MSEKSHNCRFFNGTINQKCLAGVPYDAVLADAMIPVCGFAIPCIVSSRRTKDYDAETHFPARAACCQRLALFSAEETAAHRAKLAEQMAAFDLLHPIISRVKRTHSGRNWSGTEECPACHARLSISHSARNGHCSVKCQNADCVSLIM